MRTAMGKLFSIMVKLEAPRGGPGSMRHWEQLQRDSQDLLAEGNRRHLASLLPSTWDPSLSSPCAHAASAPALGCTPCPADDEKRPSCTLCRCLLWLIHLQAVPVVMRSRQVQ